MYIELHPCMIFPQNQQKLVPQAALVQRMWLQPPFFSMGTLMECQY